MNPFGRLRSIFSNTPHAHINWRFGKKRYSHPVSAGSDNFFYNYVPSVPKGSFQFREECLRACALIDKKRQGRPVALCFTAGIDSELIARCLHSLGIPFEAYFLDIWGLNLPQFRQRDRFLSTIGKQARVIHLEKAEFYENHSLRVFRRFGCDQPTYLALTYLFEKIPGNEYIVVGDGDLHREGELFARIGNPHARRGLIPFSSASTFLYSWQNWSGRPGEYYFFSSTPELIAAAYLDPHFIHDSASCSTRQLIYKSFPEIPPRNKTTNWDDENGRKENKWIRNWLHQQCAMPELFPPDRGPVGCLVDPETIFLAESR